MARHKNRAFSTTFQRWVTVGKSLADLDNPEISALASVRASRGETNHSPLPYSTFANEVPGLIFEPPEANRYKFRQRYPLLRSAMEILSTGISVQ